MSCDLTTMQQILRVTVCACLLLFVTSVPVPGQRDVAVDNADISAEKQLIRHPHADNEITSAESATSESDDMTGEDSPIESVELVPDSSEESEEEDELYDVTLGDVIRDFLITLRNRPDIVKDLIESEKERLIARLAEVEVLDSGTGSDSLENDLAEYFQTPEQLRTLPKTVEKKAGRAAAASSESGGQPAINWPTEGGIDPKGFNYGQYLTSSSSSESEPDSSSENSNERKWMKYKSSETSESSESSETDNTSEEEDDSSRRHFESNESRDSDSSQSDDDQSRQHHRGRHRNDSSEENEEALLRLLGETQEDAGKSGQSNLSVM